MYKVSLKFYVCDALLVLTSLQFFRALHDHITLHRHSFAPQVKLRDALVSSLQFSRARDAELAWVDGQLHMNASESHMGLALEDGELRDEDEGHEKMETDQSGKEEPVDTVPVLEQLPTSQVKF